MEKEYGGHNKMGTYSETLSEGEVTRGRFKIRKGRKITLVILKELFPAKMIKSESGKREVSLDPETHCLVVGLLFVPEEPWDPKGTQESPASPQKLLGATRLTSLEPYFTNPLLVRTPRGTASSQVICPPLSSPQLPPPFTECPLP